MTVALPQDTEVRHGDRRAAAQVEEWFRTWQAARVGLVAAVDRHEPNRGNSFIVYGVVCITGESRRCLRDTCWQVHVPRTLKERALLPPTGEIQLEDRLALPGLLAGLPELERRAILLRFYGDVKQHEIGAMLGCSQNHVSRLLRSALCRMCRRLFS